MLEMLAKFQYVLEHQAGNKHSNADGLSRQTCKNFRQCRHIEERDGGPTKERVEEEV